MNTFDPTKHPRGNRTTGHAGQFATKQQSSAEVRLTCRQPWDDDPADLGTFRLNGHDYEDTTLEVVESDRGEIILQLNSGDEGEPLATATVNVPGETPAEGCVFIKDWGENSGIISELERTQVGHSTGRTVTAGFAEAKEFQVNPRVLPGEVQVAPLVSAVDDWAERTGADVTLLENHGEDESFYNARVTRPDSDVIVYLSDGTGPDDPFDHTGWTATSWLKEGDDQPSWLNTDGGPTADTPYGGVVGFLDHAFSREG